MRMIELEREREGRKKGGEREKTIKKKERKRGGERICTELQG